MLQSECEASRRPPSCGSVSLLNELPGSVGFKVFCLIGQCLSLRYLQALSYARKSAVYRSYCAATARTSLVSLIALRQELFTCCKCFFALPWTSHGCNSGACCHLGAAPWASPFSVSGGAGYHARRVRGFGLWVKNHDECGFMSALHYFISLHQPSGVRRKNVMKNTGQSQYGFTREQVIESLMGR